MPATAPVPELIDDPVAALAVLLKRWRLKPKRGARWLQDFWQAFEKHEPAACARYQRVAALGVETAALLDLSPTSQAAIRGSALLSSLMVAATNSAPESGKRPRGTISLEKELQGWRWLQISASVVEGLQTSFDASQTSAQHNGHSIEARILAVADDFEELTAGRGGVLRGLRGLRDGSRRQHDRRLLDLLWSEDGQAVCDRVLRRRGTHRERAVKELQEAAQLLEATKSGPPQPVRRQTTAHLQVAPPIEASAPPDREARPVHVEEPTEEHTPPPEPAESGTAQPARRESTARLQDKATEPAEPSPPPERDGAPKEGEKKREEKGRLLEQFRSGPPQPARQVTAARPQEETSPPAEPTSTAEAAARPREVEERREDMSKTAASEEQNTKARHREDGDSASLTARVAAAASELEEIRAAASRGLEALASIGPAMEELSTLVSRLQASLLPAQGGTDAAQPRQQSNGPRSIALRVERAKGDLDASEVVDALDALRDLRDVRVREEGSSWAVLRARTDPDTDLGILQAKVAGSLTRRLGGEDDDEAVEVTILEGT